VLFSAVFEGGVFSVGSEVVLFSVGSLTVDDPGAFAVDVASSVIFTGYAFEVIFAFVAVLFAGGAVVDAGGAVDGGGAVVDAPSVTTEAGSSPVTPTSTSQLPFSHFSFVTK